MLALILPTPQIGGLHGLPRQPQHEQRHRQHAATEREQRQQHQRRQQPEAFVQPPATAFALRHRGIDAIGGERAERFQIGIARRERGVVAAAGGRQRAQRRHLQSRGGDIAIAPEVLAAGRGAHAQHRHAITRSARIDRRGVRAAAGAVGDQQDLAARETRALQQPRRFLDRAVRAAAVARHHLRRQRIEEQRDVLAVVGERRHRVGIVGKGDQRDLAGAAAQDPRDLVARLQQPRRRHIGGVGRRGHVHRDHQRIAILQQRLRHFAPARPGQRQHGERGGQRQRDLRQPPAPAVAVAPVGLQQMRQQMRVDHLAPDVTTRALTTRPPQQRRNRQQPGQPQRAQELEIDHREHVRQRVHADLRNDSCRSSSANSAHSSDAASGHA